MFNEGPGLTSLSAIEVRLRVAPERVELAFFAHIVASAVTLAGHQL